MDVTPQQSFDALLRQYYHAWLRFHPEQAVFSGVDDYAGQLRSYKHDDIGALIALNQMMKSALEEVNETKLDEGRKLDCTLLKGAISIELHELNVHDWRFRNPVTYVPVNAICQLLIYPGNNFHQAIKRRLMAIPGYLRGAKIMLLESPQKVVPAWLDTAIHQCTIGADFIRGLVRHPFTQTKFTNPARLQPLLDEAASALLHFADFLASDIAPQAKGDYAIGEEAFNRLLKQRHFLDIDASQLLAFGQQQVDEREQELKRLVKKVRGNEDGQSWLEEMQAVHSSTNSLLDEYRNRIRRLHQWVEDQSFITLPYTQLLVVQQIPDFLQDTITFSLYLPPAPTDPKQQGIYYVTARPDDKLPPAYNKYYRDLCSVRDTFPGRHLQSVMANQYCTGNPARLINTSATLYGGWALYCEEESVKKSGLFHTNEHHFMLLRERLLHALQVVIDVKLQTGQFTPEQAAALLTEKLGLEPAWAMAEVSRYLAAPTIPLCSAVGGEMIAQLKQQHLPRSPQDIELFHDSLLSQGDIAIALVIKQIFGETVWQNVQRAVFHLDK